METVSFVIPHWNHAELLMQCLKSIEKSVGTFQKEIIVVDNASTDGSQERVQAEFKEITWIRNDTNLGYAKATNQGVNASSGQYIFLLNNDVALYPDTTEKLVNFLKISLWAGAVAPLLYYPDGQLQISCRRFPSVASIVLEKVGIEELGGFKKWKLTHKQHLQTEEVPQPMASALLVRRNCWQQVGELDEKRFPIFFNDVDWCYRLYKNTDYKIGLCKDAAAIHHEGASVKKLGYRKKIFFYKGLIHFFIKAAASAIKNLKK
ncbi:MAG: glycosyltransferase family 2 protein [Nitrospirae bacterium]|nr:glycosyltransferase family 2 protein [Nitrospirota bacterium]MBF0535749.1 glycosyltransferase family 2 protein [Nitrospirota bacterium]MBF0615778.1 glycosyltransferase family 2 protein [Nitrospirota bacterium]